MKFPISIRNTPKSKAGTDEEIRARLANLTYHEDTPATEPELKHSPRRARTLSSRLSVQPLFGQDNVGASKLTPTVDNELLSEATLKEQKERLSRRNTVHYKSPKQADYNESQAFQPPKTPKKSSPAFSLNRKSIREPLAYFKQQSKELFRRGNIKDLFPATPEKKVDEPLERNESAQQVRDNEVVDHDTPDNLQREAEIISDNQHESGRSRYHTARPSQLIEANQFEKISTIEEGNGSSDMAFAAVKSNAQSNPWPIRSSSLNADLPDVQKIDKAENKDEDSLVRAVMNSRLSDIESRPSTDTQPTTSMSKQFLAAGNTVNITKDGIEKKFFKSAHRNFFPLWASEPKPDRRWYTQREIIQRISPGEL